MSRPRTYQTEAVVIKKTRLGEADTILTLYTSHLGKIQGFARSLRKTRSKLAGHLELLTHSQVSLARGRNLDTITGSQTINSFLPLKSDLLLTSCGLYITELVNQFTADGVENYPLFQLLVGTMHNLCQRGDSSLALRHFELHLLDHVGYRPQLHNCVSCRRPLEPTTNAFCSGAGGVLCPACRSQQPLSHPLSVNGLKVLRFLQGNDFDNVRRLNVPPQLSREVEGVVRDYLKHLLEREVKSAAWLDQLRTQTESAVSAQNT